MQLPAGSETPQPAHTNIAARLSKVNAFFRLPSLYLCIPLASLPIVFLAWLLYRYTVDLPSQDQWLIPVLLDFYHRDLLSFSHIWGQHLEHRLVFPKLIMLASGILTGYNVLFENAACFILSFLTYILVIRHINRNKDVFNLELDYRWLWVLMSYLIFSLYQHYNWFNGFQVQWFLNQLAVVAGACFLASYRTTLPAFCVIGLFGLIATFSGANGLLYWIALAVILAIKGWRSDCRSEYGWAAASILIFGILLTIYLIDYHKPNTHPSLFHGLEHPFEFIHYVLAFIGNPFTKARLIAPSVNETLRATIFGGLGLLLFIFFGIYNTLKKSPPEIQGHLFFLFNGLYLLLCASMIAMGRSGFGIFQALSSRYATLPIHLWIAVFFMVFHSRIHDAVKTLFWRNVILCFKVGLVFFLFLAITDSSLNTLKSIRRDHGSKECARLAMMYDACPDCTGDIYPNQDWLYRYGIPLIKKWKLSVYRDPVPEAVIEKIPQDSWLSDKAWSLNGTDSQVEPPGKSEYFFGSFSETGHSTGVIESVPIQISSPLVVLIPYTIGPDEDDQKLGVRIEADQPVELICQTNFPIHMWGCCSFDLTEYQGHSFSIFAEDAGPEKNQWIGLAQPVLIEPLENK